MSVATELTRIQTAKADIKASIEAKGVTVPSDALINQYADYVDQIQTGGGGGQAEEDLKNLIEMDITTLNIPNGTTKIGDNAFYNHSSLKSITIPNSVTSIGNNAFDSCSGLTSITIPDSITSIGEQAFQNCVSLPIENNIQYADTYVVKAVDKSLTTYTIKEGTKWIGTSAFSQCKGLTSVTIGNSVTSIGNSAFYYCTGLKSITIPNSVTSIGNFAFYKCTVLTSVTIQATTPPTLANSNAFYNTNNCPLYVPAESLEAFKTATNWSSYASRIKPIS